MEKFATPLASCCEPASASPASFTPLWLESTQTRTRVPAAAVSGIGGGLALTGAGGAGLVTTGAAGAEESSVMAGTTAAADTLPEASVAITLKLLNASWLRGTLME